MLMLLERHEFSELGKAGHSRRERNRAIELKHRFCLLLVVEMVDALGIAPSSSAFQADADLSQLNVRCLGNLAGPNGLEPSSSS